MSATTPTEQAAVPRLGPGAAGWRVRAASPKDVAQIAAAVAELLAELGGQPADAAAMQATTRALLEDGETGAVLVAEAVLVAGADTDAGAEGAIVGVLGAGWQTAIHVPGRYALIQELWVHSSWRRHAIGAALLAALLERARRARIERVEVGLPRGSFAAFGATEAFYARNGFAPIGPRMRLVLA